MLILDFNWNISLRLNLLFNVLILVKGNGNFEVFSGQMLIE